MEHYNLWAHASVTYFGKTTAQQKIEWFAVSNYNSFQSSAHTNREWAARASLMPHTHWNRQRRRRRQTHTHEEYMKIPHTRARLTRTFCYKIRWQRRNHWDGTHHDDDDDNGVVAMASNAKTAASPCTRTRRTLSLICVRDIGLHYIFFLLFLMALFCFCRSAGWTVVRAVVMHVFCVGFVRKSPDTDYIQTPDTNILLYSVV